MHLELDRGQVVLADARTFDSFHVVRPSDVPPEPFATALQEQGAGRLVEDHVQVSTAWLRAQAPDDAWLSKLDAMVDYAFGKGWTDEERTWVRAHVVTD